MSVATAAPYGPDGRETSWTQPNGQVVSLRVFGDEYYARTETPEGYTVIHSGNTYYYAALSADGKSLVPSATRADEPAPEGLAQHIDLPKEQIRETVIANRAKFDGERTKRWNRRVEAALKIRNAAKGAELRGPEAAKAKIDAAPVSGAKRGLTILVQFPNDPATAGADPVTFPTSRDKIVRFCNSVGYDEDGNTGSVRDYFSDQSLGDVTYTQTVTQIVTLPHPRNYYNFSDYPANQVVNADIVGATAEMISDAIIILKQDDFDFSSLTLDENSRAIATNIFFAGPDSGVYAQGLWPHQYTVLPRINVGTEVDPILISDYQITNIPDAEPVIGTFCHENGHLLLGYPDIYAQNGEGVGEHCLMGSGNFLNGGRTPSPINGYFKDLSGWGKVTDLAPDEFLTAALPTTGNVSYRITNPQTPTEFFVVENRGKGDKWAQYSDDKGIAIWHVDETINGNNGNSAHYGIALEQADGRNDLENGRNRGDDGDLFDLADPKFTDNTDPSARWWGNARSYVDIEVLSGVAAKTTVAFGGVPPNTIIVSSPNGGEVIFKDSLYPITWKSNITGGVKIDLYKAGAFLMNIAPNEVSDGRYDWEVPAELKATSDYTIQISSTTNAVATMDVSDAPFSMSNASFPAGNEVPDGWFKPAFAKSRWDVTKATHFEGKSSMVSGKCGDGDTSAIGFRSNFKPGILSFYVKVSSEQGFDFVKFYLDGVAQPLIAGGGSKGLSGDVNWRFVQIPVSGGNHAFVWTYEKDDSYGEGKDAAWIDGVTLPATTQEIAIQQPEGNDLVSGDSTKTLPDTAVGDSSKAVTFTIKNRGKAKLTGLKINKGGENPAEFTVRGLEKTSLSPGKSTTFQVVFKPKDYGTREAMLKVLSNDDNEGTFLIALEGTGVGLPRIGVNQPSTNPMKDEDSRNFGIANVGTKGNVKTFTITNTGASILKDLAITKTGSHRSDFLVGALGVITLDPGDSTTFTVTFKPSGANIREAELHIASNDKKSGPFDIKVTGKGSPNALARNGSAGNLVEAVLGSEAAPSSATLSPATTVEVINGRKYLALTVTKLDGIPVGVVEVSANLLDWYSGSKHTTLVSENESTLKVRDNTPVTPEAKRYIRLK
ncbi:MAG: M6 family metalloprotease domain-containing protein [Verrucomicrobiota bacterium]